MGYYTRFDLGVISKVGFNLKQFHVEQIKSDLCKIAGYDNLFEGREIKWYSNDKDTEEVSNKNPDFLIVIVGHGKDHVDQS